MLIEQNDKKKRHRERDQCKGKEERKGWMRGPREQESEGWGVVSGWKRDTLQQKENNTKAEHCLIMKHPIKIFVQVCT